jgi:enoyl-CoA hydratase/carnithine racemase
VTPNPFLVERDDGIAVVTLNRPDRRNAFDAATMSGLTALWGALGAEADIRCLVITGADPAFCAGADMELLEGRESAGATAREELGFLPGDRVGFPVIAAVNGVCAGGGLHFVADADIVIASERASFLDPHVSVGQVTALEPLPLLLRARTDAVVRLALLGKHERLDAETAREAGLVSEVVRHDLLMARATELARQIASNSPTAVSVSRGILRSFEHELLDASLERGWQAIRSHWQHPDANEGPRAFIERRDPGWTDR